MVLLEVRGNTKEFGGLRVIDSQDLTIEKGQILGLMGQPHLLMLDETSLGLAPILIKDIFETVRKIADQGQQSLWWSRM